jgi:hypothetical protein
LRGGAEQNAVENALVVKGEFGNLFRHAQLQILDKPLSGRRQGNSLYGIAVTANTRLPNVGARTSPLLSPLPSQSPSTHRIRLALGLRLQIAQQ